MRKWTASKLLTLAGTAAWLMSVADAQAAPFVPGNLVVLQIGDGLTPLSDSRQTAGFLSEFTTTGTPIQTISLPTTTGAGGNVRLTMVADPTYGGHLLRSANGQYLTVEGYDVAPGSSNIFSDAVGDRVIGRIDAAGTIDTTTHWSSDRFLLSAASDDGTRFWFSDRTSSSNRVVWHTAYGNTSAPTQINLLSRAGTVGVYNDQLYVTFDTVATPTDPSFYGFNGLPISSQAPSAVPGVSQGNTQSQGFWFKDANTLYLADMAGRIQKWVANGGNWSLEYNLLYGAYEVPMFSQYRGLTGYVNEQGSAVLLATTYVGGGASPGNHLITLTDTGVDSEATILATAPADTSFLGVAFAPVAAPTLVPGDFDGDGDVDGADFVVWQTNFPFTPGPGASPVPEPGAIWLCAMALLVYSSRSAVRKKCEQTNHDSRSTTTQPHLHDGA